MQNAVRHLFFSWCVVSLCSCGADEGVPEPNSSQTNSDQFSDDSQRPADEDEDYQNGSPFGDRDEQPLSHDDSANTDDEAEDEVLIPGPAPELPEENDSPTDSDCYKVDPFICEIELAIIRQTNEYRASTTSQLQYSRKMTFAARVWSRKQGKRGFIGHGGFPSARYRSVDGEFGDRGDLALRGENVAYTSNGSNDDAEEIAKGFTRMWWRSSGHRRNMLGSSHTYIGVGVYVTSRGRYYATQIFGQE